jgi:hypothetical protein
MCFDDASRRLLIASHPSIASVCVIAALPGAPICGMREQFAEYRSDASCARIGGAKRTPDQVALFDSGLVRHIYLLDS